MIILGDKIDATVAVTLSMSTLASAALGNAFSNGVGIMIGSLFEMLNIIPKINIHASLEKTNKVIFAKKNWNIFRYDHWLFIWNGSSIIYEYKESRN